MLETHFFDVGRIKTASIVSYGLRHIVRLDGPHSMFSIWKTPHKKAILDGDKEMLRKYIEFSATQLSMFFSGFKSALPSHLWTLDKNVSRALNTTTVNGLIYCFRRLIEEKKTGDFDYYRNGFAKMKTGFAANQFAFRSSNWKSLGEQLYAECFA